MGIFSKTLLVWTQIFCKRIKKIRFQKYPDTCRRGLNGILYLAKLSHMPRYGLPPKKDREQHCQNKVSFQRKGSNIALKVLLYFEKVENTLLGINEIASLLKDLARVLIRR